MAQPKKRQPVRKTKQQIRRQRQLTVIGGVVAIFLVIFLFGFFTGRSGGGANAQTIATTVSNLGANAQITYDYTKTISETDRESDYYGWTRAKNLKDFTILYQGSMKIGSDTSKVTKDNITIKGKKVTVSVPTAKIVSNDIDQSSISYFDSDSNALKPIDGITQFEEFCNVRKPIDEQEAFDSGKVSAAQERLTNVLEYAIKGMGFETVEVQFQNN